MRSVHRVGDGRRRRATRGIAATDGAGDIAAGLAAVAPIDAVAIAAPMQVPRVRWRAEPWHIDRDDDAALLAELERTLPPLGDVLGGQPTREVPVATPRS